MEDRNSRDPLARAAELAQVAQLVVAILTLILMA